MQSDPAVRRYTSIWSCLVASAERICEPADWWQWSQARGWMLVTKSLQADAYSAAPIPLLTTAGIFAGLSALLRLRMRCVANAGADREMVLRAAPGRWRSKL